MALGILGSLAPACVGDGVPNDTGKVVIRPGDRVVLLGDSITASYPWHTQFTTAINAFYNSRGLTPPTFINSGVDGDATNDIDVQTRVIDHDPDVLIYGPMGFNDVGNIAEETSATQYAATWDASLAALPGLRTLGISPWVRLTPGQGTDSGHIAAFQSLRTVFAGICRDRGIPFVDVRAYWDRANYTQSQQLALNADGAHPTDPLGRALISSHVLFQTNMRTE